MGLKAILGTAAHQIPKGVWILGFVSLLMDVSSEMIHALLPIYMVTVLGTSALTVGLVEGIAESTASVTKVFSGALSDRLGRRKWLAVLGYGIAALTKPVFPLAQTVEWVVAARFLDRIGKGIRGAPRDALIADISPPELRGASFGLRQSLDTVGAFLGPLLAIAVMGLTGSFITVFWIAVVPAFLSAGLIILAVKEPARTQSRTPVRMPLRRAELRRLGAAYWLIVGIATTFTLARFSEAFLVLKAQSVGLAIVFVPAVLVLMNLVYALAAYPAGLLSDKIGRLTLLFVGFLVLIAADAVLGVAGNILGASVGIALWGLHMGLTQGLLSTLVADVAPSDLRGTAFGVFNLATGVTLLAASALAGFLWDVAGPQTTFLVGAALTSLACLGLLVVRGRIAAASAVR